MPAASILQNYANDFSKIYRKQKTNLDFVLFAPKVLLEQDFISI